MVEDLDDDDDDEVLLFNLRMLVSVAGKGRNRLDMGVNLGMYSGAIDMEFGEVVDWDCWRRLRGVMRGRGCCCCCWGLLRGVVRKSANGRGCGDADSSWVSRGVADGGGDVG